MNSLSADQMEELADEMVELAETGYFSVHNRNAVRPGNLFDSGLFSQSAQNIAERGQDRRPEYAIAADLTLRSDITNVRTRILNSLSSLKREAPAKCHEIFSKRFLDEFDWITQRRSEIVSHTVNHQKEFVAEPYNPLLLKELNQRDLADVIGCHSTTVSRLIKDLLIEFPDTAVREFAILTPGSSLSLLKGRYVVGLLSKDARYFDRATSSWKITDEELTVIVRTEYNLDVQRRVVTNYRRWVDEYLLKPRRSPGRDSEVDTDQDEGL